MIRGIGVDLVEITRMAAAYSRHGDRLIRRICTPTEIVQMSREKDILPKLAAIFGVKEAVMKALGTGMKGVGWQEIDTSSASVGRVDTLLCRRALDVARRLGVKQYTFSVTVSGDIVLTAAVLSGD